MSIWRMQLHPNESNKAIFHSVQCLMAGYIGLDFEDDRGDLSLKNDNERKTNNIQAFVSEIIQNDRIVIFAHNRPIAMVTEIEPYNYIKNTVPELNIWFRHFRRFNKISFYQDYFGNKFPNPEIIMTNTFSGVSEDSETGKLADSWQI